MPAGIKAAPANLYVHFPFCRRKCTYCALHSHAGSTPELRATYVSRLAESVRAMASGSDTQQTPCALRPAGLETIYLGGGSPALCDLRPLFDALAPLAGENCEFTVELHPLDVTREKLKELKDGGVNRISMGVQSLDDDVLRHMGRGYTFADAERAFSMIRECFDNAGIDLIVGYPSIGDAASKSEEERLLENALSERRERLAKWGLRHCSAYSLILEEKSLLGKLVARQNRSGLDASNRGQTPKNWGETPIKLHSDDEILDKIAVISNFLKSIGLQRYEISNYAVPGYECRHNMATWRGEDYIGLGDGAHGRVGLLRTANWWPAPWGQTPLKWGATPKDWGQTPETEEVSSEKDEIERKIFRLRTREGLDADGHPKWTGILDNFASEGLLVKDGLRYRLTERGTEVCDAILAELV